jgi:predicted AAA+ superfamily ATPase
LRDYVAAALTGGFPEALTRDSYDRNDWLRGYLTQLIHRDAPDLVGLRDSNGRHEVDVVLEYPGLGLVGLEVKTSATVDAKDAKHLAWLRDERGDSFVRGIMLYTGPRPRELDDRLIAAAIASLWQ